MKLPKLFSLLAFSIGTLSQLSAQSNPPIYAGPYEQPHAGQFVGEWTRSDGTYEMKISSEAGELKVEYFNPAPIHVESGAVKESDEGLILAVILRDEGYPGSAYELRYIPQYRVLAGTYIIPGQAPTEVFFTQ